MLFGGKGDTVRLGDIWEFSLDSLTWSKKDQGEKNKFAPRSFHELATDADTGEIYLHGGRDIFKGTWMILKAIFFWSDNFSL